MLKYRVERLREILDPNYKLELPEQLTEGTGEPKTIIRSNDFITTPQEAFAKSSPNLTRTARAPKSHSKTPPITKTSPDMVPSVVTKTAEKSSNTTRKPSPTQPNGASTTPTNYRKSAATSHDGPSPHTPQQATSQPQPSTSSTPTKTTK